MKTHLDLFSGIGGFSLAAQWAGFQTIAFCEIEPYAQQVLIEKFGAVLADTKCGSNKHKGGEPESGGEQVGQEIGDGNQLRPAIGSDGRPTLHPDIFTLDGTRYRGVTLVTGGFPCQPFSCSGKRRGKEDDRHLWPQMLRVIAEARPAFVLAENVPGIINMELDHCLSDLEAIGYATGTLVVPACAVDARHRRDRVWIMAHAKHASSARQRQHGGKVLSIAESERPNVCSCSISNSNRARLQASRGSGEGSGEGTTAFGSDRPGAQWLPEPNVGRVAHGVPSRTHCLRALGNAIVPQVAYQILKALP